MFNKETIKRIFVEFWENALPEIFPRTLTVPLKPKKVVVIWGPRRSGKSFYLYHLASSLWQQGLPKNQVVYINFEDDRLPRLRPSDLQFILEAYFELLPENKGKQLYFLLDEIQNIDGWEAFVRRLYEIEKISVFVTGSSSKLLSREIATTLRGRSISYAFYPLSFIEFLRFKKTHVTEHAPYTHERFKLQKHLEEYLTWGRFPEVVLEEDITLKKKILQEYFQALLYQDLADRFSLENTLFLEELLKYLITNITSLFSINAYYKLVSQTIPVAKDTVFSYYEKAAESFYFSYLPMFSYSLKVQRVNPKKISLLDNGFRQTASTQFSPDGGKLAENLVGRFLLEKEDTQVFYWKNNHEVDFVVKEGTSLSAVNISYSSKLKPREIEGLLEFKKTFPRTTQLLLLTKDVKELKDGITYMPLWEYLLR